MENDFNDNELDHAFREGIEPMEIEPSDSFWNKTEAGILQKENSSFRRKLFLWRTIAAVLIICLLMSGGYIFILQNKSSVLNNESSIVAVNSPIKNEELQNEHPASVSKKMLAENTITAKHTENKLEQSSSIREPQQLRIGKNTSVNSFFGSPALTQQKNIEQNLKVKSETKDITIQNVLKDSIPQITLNNKINDSISKDSSSVVAQLPNNSPKTSNSIQAKNLLSRIYISAFYSPSYNHLSFRDKSENDGVNLEELAENVNEQHSYSVGIQSGYDLNKNWSVSTGCNYFVAALDIKPTTIYAQQGVNGEVNYSFATSSGIVQFPSDVNTQVGNSMKILNTSTQTLNFISIPLLVTYSYPVKKFIFFGCAGFSTHVLIKNQTDIKLEDNVSGNEEDKIFTSIEGLKNIHYGFSFGIGAKYLITKRFFILAEPSVAGALTSINHNVPIKNNPYFFGCEIGAGIHF